MYIVELITRAGTICESFPSYEEARRRVDQFPAGSLLSLPLIFKELADGSQRLVREDGKPLQWHRLPDDRPAGPDEPIPLSEGPLECSLGEAPLPLTWPELEEGEGTG